MSFFHTEDGPLEHEIERVETVIDKGLVICWHVSRSFYSGYKIHHIDCILYLETLITQAGTKMEAQRGCDFRFHHI